MAKNRSFQGAGPSNRQLRVGELIRRALSDLLMRGEVHDPDLQRMSITVGEVRVTPDLRQARVFVLPLGGKGKDEAMEALNRNKGEIRRLVTREIKMKHSPDLAFFPDETFDQMDETRRLLSEDRVRKDLED
ncbi:30S ribosome-binding factor RbfA [Loktanella sp. IMCC34160]|uniref:30S ribosome-binding factor RbfA n=1 Tax=Rhodobacterales TaxID=204455 RepID=UPI00101D5F46|nr:30S ribosome-binding factor RbfA [Loktanella sp. IMCC34160]RYG91222.1 30S ribosome-binding factor RbfA [Loktanella sp. IMCC34160]